MTATSATKAAASAASSIFGSRTASAEKPAATETDTFPIPLRDGFVVKLELPRNFKRTDADKISRVLMALSDEEAGPAPPIPFTRT